jgi:hypothetical protein
MCITCSRLSYLFWISIIEVFTSMRQSSIFSSILSSTFYFFVYNNRIKENSVYAIETNHVELLWYLLSSIVEGTNDENKHIVLMNKSTKQRIKACGVDFFYAQFMNMKFVKGFCDENKFRSGKLIPYIFSNRTLMFWNSFY